MSLKKQNKTREKFLKFSTESLISCKVHLDETRLRLYFTSSNQKRLTGLVSHKSVWQRAYRSSTSSCAKYTGPPSALSTDDSVFTEDNRANLVQELQMSINNTTDAEQDREPGSVPNNRVVSQPLKIEPRNNSSGIPGGLNMRGHGAATVPEGLISIPTHRTLPKMNEACADFQPHTSPSTVTAFLPAGGTVT